MTEEEFQPPPFARDPDGYVPPPQRPGRGLLFGLLATVVLALAVVVTLALTAGTDTEDGQPVAASTARTAGPPHTTSTSVRTQGQTCAQLRTGLTAKLKISLAEGGTPPKGVPLPPRAPGAVCTAQDSSGNPLGILLGYPGQKNSDYVTRLGAAKYRAVGAQAGLRFYRRTGSDLLIAVTVVQGELVILVGKTS